MLNKYYYPIFLDLVQKRVLILGSGEMAREKLPKLLEASALITIIDYKIEDQTRKQFPKVRYIQKAWCINDIRSEYQLIFSALANKESNQLLQLECNKKNIFFNAVDNPENCDYILPSVLRRSSLVVAISSTGISPVLTQKLRDQINKMWGDELEQLVSWIFKKRRELYQLLPTSEERKYFWQLFFEYDPLNQIKNNSIEIVDELWNKCLQER